MGLARRLAMESSDASPAGRVSGPRGHLSTRGRAPAAEALAMPGDRRSAGLASRLLVEGAEPMIPDAATMDKPVAGARTGGRRWIVLGSAGALVVLAALALVAPALRRWARAERVVDADRVRIAAVARGDLERDVAIQGKVVAALHPTLYSPAAGIVTLEVKAGTEVRKGHTLARIDSPELASRLVQEQAALASLESELGRSGSPPGRRRCGPSRRSTCWRSSGMRPSAR